MDSKTRFWLILEGDLGDCGSESLHYTQKVRSEVATDREPGALLYTGCQMIGDIHTNNSCKNNKKAQKTRKTHQKLPR